jgi:polysaccharide biosynthesis protein PslA
MSLQADNKPVDRVAQIAVQDEALPAIGLGQWIKRLVDIIVASLGLILFAPILLLASLAISLDSGGPILVWEALPESNDQAIRVLKFRVACTAGNGVNRRRLTQVGQMLSMTGIDELPQLVNVLLGEVSIVGRRNVYRWSASIF